MRDLLLQGGEARIVEEWREPGIKRRGADSGGAGVGRAVERSEGLVLFPERGVDRGEVHLIDVTALRERLEVGQDAARLVLPAELRVTDRELEVWLAHEIGRERFITLSRFCPTILGGIDARDRIDIIKKRGSISITRSASCSAGSYFPRAISMKQPNDPVWDIEKGKHLSRDLDEQPGNRDVGDGDAVNATAL